METVSPPAAEREPDPVTPDVHLDGPATWESENLPCGYPFNVVRYGETTSDPAKVSCAGCRATLPKPLAAVACGACNGSGTTGSLDTDVFECTACDGTGLAARHRDEFEQDQRDMALYDAEAVERAQPAAAPVCDASCCAGREIPWPDALNPHLPQPGYTPRPYGQGPAPAEPERRTVGLEVLTDELFQQETDRRHAEADGGRFEKLPDDARVAVVLRTDGELVAIEDTDSTWRRHIPNMPTYILSRLLEQVGNCAVGGLVGVPEVKALMPTPDVLAALDGRDPGLWTGWVPVVYRTVQPGWQVMTMPPPPYDPTPELVANTASCDVDGCENGVDCVVLTLPSGKVHMTSWRSVHVRIPAQVTA